MSWEGNANVILSLSPWQNLEDHEFKVLLTIFLVSGFVGASSLEVGAIIPPFLAEFSAVLACLTFFVVLASPKTTLLSMSSLFEANGMLGFLVLAPRLPSLGILGIQKPT